MLGHGAHKENFLQAIEADRLSHAYIFTGADGIGKKLFAKELARAILCEKGSKFGDCDCATCKQVKLGVYPDLHILETKEDLNIEGIRAISEISAFSPYVGRWKVIIIDNAHILSQGSAESANALLKTLEEPGENTIIILVTSHAEKLLATIRSRCITVQFAPLTDKELYTVLSKEYPETGWADIIEYAGGSVSKAKLIADLDIKGFLNVLSSGDKTSLGMYLFKVTDKDILLQLCDILYVYFTKRFEEGANPVYITIVEHIAKLRNDLGYNVNVSLKLAELYIYLAMA